MSGAAQVCREMYVATLLNYTVSVTCKLPPSVVAAEQNCVELQGLGLAPRLVKLLASPDKATRAHAAIALSPLAAHSKTEQSLCPCFGLIYMYTYV